MASLNLIEKITILFSEGKGQQAIDILTEESLRLKRDGKMGASQKLANIIKKIPTLKKSFSGVPSIDDIKFSDISTTNVSGLIKKDYQNTIYFLLIEFYTMDRQEQERHCLQILLRNI